MERWVVMISERVDPDPASREVPGLLADITLRGWTYLATRQTIEVGPKDGQLAVINRDRNLIAVALFNGVVDELPTNLLPGIYRNYPLENARNWFQLTRFEPIYPPVNLGVLGWNLISGLPLTLESCPREGGALLFQARSA
jgi:hypothetical protein